MAAAEPSSQAAQAMTASAFMSVSLDPALAAVSLANDCRTHAVINSTGSYGVIILRMDQARLALHFAGITSAKLGPSVFRFVDGVPVLEHCLSCLVATVVGAYEAGDHTIFVGEIDHLEVRDAAGLPLTHFAGAFGEIHRGKPMPPGWVDGLLDRLG